jgi:hypothetical protein
MKTNRFAPTTVLAGACRSASLRVFGGLACATIATLGGASAASANNIAPTNGPAAVAPAPTNAQTIATFSLKPNGKFLPCLAEYPNDASRQPQIEVTVVRESLNDHLSLHGKYIKPNLRFDMFTVENDPFQADGTANAAFTTFGFAWYQSDLLANSHGEMFAAIRTVLLDQIFGFDPAVPVGPTNTFEVGFWFNDPNDAAACGFDVTKPTPFNGEHKAGPLAAISLPSASTGLGPLCTNPDTSVSPARCNP